jgi:hypothetical protein
MMADTGIGRILPTEVRFKATSNTPWAHASTSRVAHLFDNRRHGCLRQNMHLDQRLRGCQADTVDADSGAARREDARSSRKQAT